MSAETIPANGNVRCALLGFVLAATASFGQTSPGTGKPENLTAAALLEFPVVMRQNVVAGQTPVGTKVEAKLTVATLVKGVVIPADAVFSGEVTESAAKTATEPSRLAIRMDSAQWKSSGVPVSLGLTPKIYLTAWFYPAPPLTGRNREHSSDHSYDLPDASSNPRMTTGIAAYPGPRNPTAPPFPGAGTGVDTEPPPLPDNSKHRTLMKDVESTSTQAGVITLTSKRFDVKLDKSTTYVLASGDLQAMKQSPKVSTGEPAKR